MTVQTTKVMITLPPALLANIDEQAAREQTSRSGFIRQVLERYLGDQRRAELRERLIEGYKFRSKESLELAEEFLVAENEALNANAPWEE